MPVRRKRKGSGQEEQLRLLRQILAELQALNASLAAGKAGMQAKLTEDGNSGDEELEEYE